MLCSVESWATKAMADVRKPFAQAAGNVLKQVWHTKVSIDDFPDPLNERGFDGVCRSHT